MTENTASGLHSPNIRILMNKNEDIAAALYTHHSVNDLEYRL